MRHVARPRFACAVLLACLAGARAQEAVPLWEHGDRLLAIERLRTEIGTSPAPELRARLVTWQIAVHRYRAALADAGPCGAPCDALRGEAHYHLGEYAEALPLLSRTDGLHLLWRVDALEALGRFRESDAELVRAREVLGADDPRVLGAEGRRLLRMAQPAGAVGAFQAALERDPLDGEALYGLGRALIQAGKREQGLAALERHRALVPLLDAFDFARRGVDLAPAHGPNWTALGDAERALGRLERAEAAYRRCEELAAGEALVPNALRWARLLAEDRADPAAATALLRRTVSRQADARLYVRLGDLELASGRAAQAREAYERALALRPADAEIAARLERARAAEGRR
jgi:tetratricopeptide (TPR) repeat protein